jgi:Lrp/AsnC family leucine-responsive transcriptional regulator
MGNVRVENLDEIDRKLLALLQDNDRLALAELSKATGSAPSTINDRIKRLVRNGVITGFHARVAAEAIGLELLAFVLVGWSDPKVESRFIERIQKSPQVLECHHITGAWNYLMKVRVRNTRELEAFLANTVKAVSGVQRTDTMIVLSSAKETWAMSP